MQKAICSAEKFLNKHDYVFEKKTRLKCSEKAKIPEEEKNYYLHLWHRKKKQMKLSFKNNFYSKNFI